MALNSLTVENEGKSSGLISFSRKIPFQQGCPFGPFQQGMCRRTSGTVGKGDVGWRWRCLSAGLVSQSECRRMRRAGQRGSSAVRVRRFVGVVDGIGPHQCQRMRTPHGVGGVAEVFNTFSPYTTRALTMPPGDACSTAGETTDNRTVAAVCFPARSGRGYRSASGCGGKGCRPFRGRCVWFQ